jgi:hypothetical protein
MFRRIASMLTVVSAVAVAAVVSAQAPQTPEKDDIPVFLQQLEQAIRSGAPPQYFALLGDSANRDRAAAFTDNELVSGATRVVLQERDRAPLKGALPGNGYELIVDVFIEFGNRARAATWRLDVKRPADGAPWRIADQEQLTSVEGLYRLSLNPAKQYDVRNLTIAAEDFELELPQGSVFVAETDQGVTGLVLLGRGEMRFHPKPETEKGQVKIFCGKETLDTAFDAAFVRVNPGEFDSRVSTEHLTGRPVDARMLRRADEVFREESPKSFGLDLGDLSRDAWSLLPNYGDMLAEVRTRKYDVLTYARSGAEAEDITLFDRKRHKNISIYSSEQKMARRGQFYNEDDLTDYDVLDYDIDLAVAPERLFLEGRARLRIRVRSPLLGTVTLRLADSLVVRSIAAEQFGRLFAVRVRNQNSIVLNLPTAVPRDTILTFTIAYGGRLEPQGPDRETIAPQTRGSQMQEEVSLIAPEPSYLYSNRSFWYPQSAVTDYATATLRITIPQQYDCVASGDLAPGSPTIADGKPTPRKIYVFTATQPLRYLAFVISRFTRSDTATVGLALDPPGDSDGLPPLTGASYESLNLAVETNPRQAQRGREYAERAADIVQFYSSLVGDCPYPSFTLAIVERDRPGGHSPAYFAALNQPLPSTPYTWRNDPEVFEGFPEFYLAHELAHQWWGQAVGWRNYHEQWLSEGFAQYFSLLYAKHHRGDDVFESVLRRLRRWGMEESPQGPVYLGYRLGHIRGEPRVFSALVYNKSAAVLHMLRRLVGDDAFFRGLRRFYRVSRFRKVGTEDFRAAMEAETTMTLDRFFQKWIYGSTLPKLKLGYRVEGKDVVLHVEQLGDVFDVPLSVTLEYADRKPEDVIVRVTERTVDMRVPLAGVLRGIDFNKDDGALADVVR